MTLTSIGLIVGSNSRESINRKLAEATVKASPAQLSFFEIRIDDLPMFNRDLLAAVPEQVTRFVSECRRAAGFFIVMPEHNRSVPAVLKNAIDWGSKPKESNVWRRKPCAMAGTSPGTIGTAVGQQHLRQILGVLGAVVLGGEAYVSYKPELIGDDGSFAVESTRQFMQDYMTEFSGLVSHLS